ncbi:MAG: c-type cytochrome [Xanthobacteraceae bacterium]
MSVRLRRRVVRITSIVAGVLAALAIGGLLFAWLGVYNVAASRGHWMITDWMLQFGMRQSVATHSLAVDPPPLNDEDLIRLGAAHFHGGCAYCHGAPGFPRNPLVQGMLPQPPDLSLVSGNWRDRELFWIVKHGIKYTGMPAWPSPARDDEVWAVTAFLKRLPALDASGYRDLAMGDVALPPEGGRDIALGRIAEQAAGACARCHGAGGRRPRSALVPVLHGQSAEFLSAALHAYANGTRASGIMQTVAADLAPGVIERVAAYYANLAPPERQLAAQNASRERGRTLATAGAPESGIPPCLACHGPEALPSYPRLGGQNAAYMKGQLRLWRDGTRPLSGASAIMAPIARLLTDQQAEEVSAFFEALPASPSDAKKRP